MLSEPPQHSAVGPQEKEDTSVEDVYGYDCPRPVVPPAPTRRNLSDVSCSFAAFNSLSIEASVEAGQYLQVSPAVDFFLMPTSLTVLENKLVTQISKSSKL